MRRFFYTVFGGLGAIFFGVVIAYAGSVGWHALLPFIPGVRLPSWSLVASAIIPTPQDGTSISGFSRTIRYTADEEEDLINSAAQALPYAADKKITAAAYVVKNLTVSGSPIEHNPDKLLPIASLTKLITAIVARQNFAPGDRITITDNIRGTYGNTASFKTGETFSAADLYYPLLMVSSNDAAEAFAQSFGRKNFIKAMNDFTQSIGAYRTYFDDPSGLSPNNVSTPNDLVIILKWIREHDPEIIAITDIKAKTVRNHTWVNPTHFLNWSNYIGGKNGYIPEANRTAASLFALGQNKNVYAIVVLGSDSRDSDEMTLLSKVK